MSSGTATFNVAFAAFQEPRHHFSFSGCFRFMVRAIEEAGFEVTTPGHGQPQPLRQLGQRLLPLGRFRSQRVAPLEAILGDIERKAADVVFAPVGSEIVPAVPAGIPVVYATDTTVKLAHKGYRKLAELSPASLRARHDLEGRAIARADALVYSSRWAAASAIEDYGADPAKIRIAPLGAPLDAAPPEIIAETRPFGRVVRLLWIGGDWKRKGSDLAVETLAYLRATGLPAELHIVGTPPPGALPAGVVTHGFLDRTRPGQRAKNDLLFATCHVLLLPTRADCSPLALAEASAWSMPQVATRVGGVPEVCVDGENGVLVDSDGSVAELAGAVRRLVSDKASYRRACRRARRSYRARLTWSGWSATVAEALRTAAAVRGSDLPSPKILGYSAPVAKVSSSC